MADIPLFTLDAAGRFRLAHDDLQWILQKRRGNPGARSSGFAGVSFVATFKRILLDVMREKGVELTVEAVAKLEALPATFKEFRFALAHAREPQEHVGEARKADSGSRTPETLAMAPPPPLENPRDQRREVGLDCDGIRRHRAGHLAVE